MSPVPQIVLTEYLHESSTALTDSLSSLARNSQAAAFKPSLRSPRHEDLFIEQSPKKEEKKLVLLLTELEMRVLTSLEVEEVKKTAGDTLNTITISPDTTELTSQEVQLSEHPFLLCFQKEQTAQDAYRRLHSLLVSSRPVPKPRMKSSSSPPGQLDCLAEALVRGIDSGDRIVTLQHTDRDNQRKPKKDVRQSTYKRLDSLEETIRELENTLIEIGGHSTVEQLYTDTPAQTSPAQTSSETKKPPVPPKPSSLSRASIQVYTASLLCRLQL